MFHLVLHEMRQEVRSEELTKLYRYILRLARRVLVVADKLLSIIRTSGDKL